MASDKRDWEKLYDLFLSSNNRKDLEQLMLLFFTQSERGFILDRLRIFRALLEGKHSQREIAEKLGVSISKITAGSNELRRTPEAAKKRLRAFLLGDEGQ